MSWRSQRFVAALVALLGVTACAPADPGIVVRGVPLTDAEIEQGRVLYLENCAACHGAEGQGQFPKAPLEPDVTGRRGAPPHDETGHTWHHSDELLFRYVRDGGFSDPAHFYTMPPFGDRLTDEQILQVLAYIKTMWTDEQRANQRALTQAEMDQFR